MNPRVTELRLFDISKITPGVAVDLSHINSCPSVKGIAGGLGLHKALDGTDLIVITAARKLPKKETNLTPDLFKANRKTIFNIMRAVIAYAPHALIAIVTKPINIMVPFASEIMMKFSDYDPRKIFGVTTLDVVRASTIVARLNRVRPEAQYVPVIGGHEGATIIPLLSRCNPSVYGGCKVVQYLTKKIQTAEFDVVAKKAGLGSNTLARAYAVERFTHSLLRGLAGEEVIECAFVRSEVTCCPYFSTPVVLGPCGVKHNLGIGRVNYFEKDLIDRSIPILNENIKIAIDYFKSREKDILPRLSK